MKSASSVCGEQTRPGENMTVYVTKENYTMTYTEFASICASVNKDQADREKLLNWRYPWFNVCFNYFYLFLIVLLAVSLIWWSGIIRKEHKDAEAQAERDRIYAAELAQAEENQRLAEEQRLADQEAMLDRWSEAGAHMLYGIRNFVDKYHYSEKDMETYLRCAWNRYLTHGKLTDLDVLIYTPEQFLACYKTSPALKEYKDLARKYFTAWQNETELPCDPSYVFAELLPDGIFLSKKYGADGYVRRWQAE